MLTYMEVHLYYTLPVLGILLWLLRPFDSKEDRFKYQFLACIAFFTASLWDNYIVYHKAWSYCPTCVVAVIGYVPLEEYMFFIIMTFMTISFTNLVMRWHLPSTFIRPQTPLIQTWSVRGVPIMALMIIAYKAWKLAVPAKPLFYGACILWYVCPVLAILWYGSGEYMLQRPLSVILSITLPTLYLCWVDKIAIAAGTWHISLRTSTGKFVSSDLPLEEFMFFVLINTVLVFATCTIDRAQAVTQLFNKHRHNTLDQLKTLLWAYLVPDQMLNPQVINDLSITWGILKSASKSFHTASAVFNYAVRQDLSVLYGFCRATDDLCDNESVPGKRRERQLQATRQFVKTLYAEKQLTEAHYSQLPVTCIPAYRAFATHLRYIVSEESVYELLDGYRWDLERRSVKDEDDLAYYSACVASSVGEMCTRIIAHHGQCSLSSDTIHRARQMGLVLQYINIARDIVTDSQDLHRCYLPQNWLTQQEIENLQLGQPRELSDRRLRQISLKLVSKAELMMKQAEAGIDDLPYCQGGLRAACQVYAGIGQCLKLSSGYPDRAYLEKRERIKIVLKSIYL
ncbi:terpenoid synthase [Rhizopus microsporus var. microsporus]|uniref:Bifunctional lycopene cyclase/phytoene synthase n=2 Tax=Rhizopus microsporus TaxID=58291 RepID=A0A2G4SFV8_RHIZD|nr:lycopene cyclase [Rhizopus microsporus ATCC 52813]ORE02406.1 terpenoid synthase [Rhizopus microsporus var. microsporus]PHZ07653.1 lycopene cyclase [Rhizopus microsporus ATCC 52813]